LRAASLSRISFRIESNTSDMPALMAWADIAIAGAGSTCWELAFMGLPSIVLPLAENQKPIARELAARQMAWTLPAVTEFQTQLPSRIAALCADAATRAEMARRAQKIVDGKGGARVVQRMNSPAIHLRRARAEDSHLLWEWANDPVTRANSFSTAPIPWREHEIWFANKLNSPESVIWIAWTEDDKAIGQIRFELQQADATVSTCISPEMRGRGYGTHLIARGSAELFCASQVETIHAYVKPENEISLGAFLKVGYRNLGTEQYKEFLALHLRLDRNEYAI
jgi:RimJ/RimL family protein N-acetyltransferase